MTTRETLEAALVADPDDTALHAAYADLLIEEGDPRGEYVRLSLLEEDRNQPASQLRGIEQAMFELRQRHEAAWLGPLARFLERPRARSVAEPMEPNVSVIWRRGWIDAIRVGQLNQDIINAIAGCPLTRILGELSIEQNRTDPTRVGAAYLPGEDGLGRDDIDEMGTHLDMTPLAETGRLRALRVFKLGSFADGILASGWEMEEYLREANRLEEVRLCCDPLDWGFLWGAEFQRLRVIHAAGGQSPPPFGLFADTVTVPNLRDLFLDRETYPPQTPESAANRRELTGGDFLSLHRPNGLQSLEHFTLRDSSVGDTGLRLILEAPFFRRLKTLDLCRCNITDEGAELLARHPHTPNLTSLRLAGNLLSPIGLDALDALGFTIGEQAFGMPPEPDDDFEFGIPGGAYPL